MLQSRFNNGDVILLNDDADTFLKKSLVEICHPQVEYFADQNPQSQHPIAPKFKIQKYIEEFCQKVTPVAPSRSSTDRRCTWTSSELSVIIKVGKDETCQMSYKSGRHYNLT